MQSNKRFFATLDGIRGVAATVVVMGHLQPYFGNEMAPEGILAVDIFFILSGVVIANAYEDRLRSGLTVLDFARIRLIRLYPLYILGTGIGLLAILLGFWWYREVGYLPLVLILAVTILPNPFVTQVFPLNPPAWSLFLELFANITYAFALRFLTSRVLISVVTISALGLAGTLYIRPNHDLGVGWTMETLYGGFFRVGYSFFVGLLLYRLFASKKSAQRHDLRMAFMPWLLLGLVVLMLGVARPPASVRPYYEFAAVVLLFPTVIYCALWFEPIGVGAKICKFLGSISYAVYAIHMPLSWLLGFLMEKITGVPGESWAPWTGFCFIGVLLPFCWALDKYYDGPLRHFLLARGQSRLAVMTEKA